MATVVERAVPPGPQTRLPGRNLVGLRRDPIGFLTRLAQEYGEIAHFKIGPQEVYLFNNPDHIREVLVTNHRRFHKGRGLERAKRMLGEGLLTSEDEFHLRQRRLAQPAFHRQRVEAYVRVMAEYAARKSESWQDGQRLDIFQEMQGLTLQIVGKTLFDANVDHETGDIGQALNDAMEMFRHVALPFADLIERLPLPHVRRFKRARARLDGTIYRIIEERRAAATDRGDLLSMLLMAQDTEGDGGQMTNLQLRDEALTIFLAGHETTATALTWAWYLLSQHPEVEQRWQAELDTTLGNRLPEVADLPNLPYTRMIAAETMRLYPPAWTMGRKVLQDYPVGGYVIPAGAIILMSQYLMHHDRRFFPDPAKFDPLRWTPEEVAKRPKFSYFPFGAGPRVCIGEAFAWMELVVLLATLGRQWRMSLAPGQVVAMQPLITLRPRFGMQMTLERRPAAEQS